MIELGKVQTLKVLREKEFGVYLGENDQDSGILLPKKQVPPQTKPGDQIEVFVYKDSQDRLIATTNRPKLQVGETAVLTVKDVAKIGAFLDMGLEKDLLLPFKEQNHKVRQGENCLVAEGLSFDPHALSSGNADCLLCRPDRKRSLPGHTSDAHGQCR